jgi:hypothetical protein
VVAGASPYVLRLAPIRYDLAPTLALLAAVAVFVLNAPSLTKGGGERPAIFAGLVGAGGALLKWIPGLLLPFMAGDYWRRRDWRGLAALLGAAGLLLALGLLPFWLADPEKFWNPYAYQGSRHLIGESLPFLWQWAVLDPAHALPARPWGEPEAILLSNGLLTAVQVALTALPALAALRWAHDRAAWARWGLIAVAVFILANRIFSPQFLLTLGFTWAAALLLARPPVARVALALAGLIAAGGANFLVFPLWPPWWPGASAVLFAVGVGLTALCVRKL